MAAPLQLTDVAHGEQKGWRRSQHLVDSLPYVDGLSPSEKAAVDKLIEEEVRGGAGRAQGRGGSAAAARRPAVAACARTPRLPCLISLQMRSSSKKPSDYLEELPPLPETRFKARAPAAATAAACLLATGLPTAAAALPP